MCEGTNEGDTLWSDTAHTIKDIPEFLRQSILFQSPKNSVEVGTSFTIVCPPDSDIFVAYKKGWDYGDFAVSQCQSPSSLDTLHVKKTETWQPKLGGSLSYKKPPGKLNNPIIQYTLPHIIHRNTGCMTSISLPPTRKNAKFAIFIKEGKTRI